MDTVSPQTLANVYTTHNANGVSIIGIMESSNGGDNNFEMVYKLKLNTYTKPYPTNSSFNFMPNCIDNQSDLYIGPNVNCVELFNNPCNNFASNIIIHIHNNITNC
jgi:hypothetical protein